MQIKATKLFSRVDRAGVADAHWYLIPFHLRPVTKICALSDDKAVKVIAVATDGQLWTSKCLSTVQQLLDDTKHMEWLAEVDEEEHTLRQSAFQLIRRLNKVR